LSNAEKAIPMPTDADRPYWEGARERRLVLPRCTQCGLVSARQRLICPHCQGESSEWVEVSGRGKLHSYAIVYPSTISGFREETPYIVCHAYIEEEPTCYITTNLVGVDPADFDRLNIELPVVMSYEDRGEVVVPQWRLA
jgi:uncharacterized OB-fold protein